MEIFSGIDPVIVNWVLIPLMIFFARLLDVTLGTLRIVFISKGDKVTAPILGFIEVLIWIVAIGQVIQNLNNVASYLAWAAGFATGNFIGMYIEEKLALGQMIVRVITAKPADELIAQMKKLGYQFTCVDATGNQGRVNLLFTIVRRKDLKRVISLVHAHNPQAVYTVEDVQKVSEFAMPEIGNDKRNFARRLFPVKKAK